MVEWIIFILITALLIAFPVLTKALDGGGGIIVGVVAVVIHLILGLTAFYYAAILFAAVVIVRFIAKYFGKSYSEKNNKNTAISCLSLFGLTIPVLLIYHLARRDDLGSDYNFDYYFIIYYSIISSAFAIALAHALDNFASSATHAITNKRVLPFSQGAYTLIGATGAVLASLSAGLIYYIIERNIIQSVVITSMGILAYVANVFLSVKLFDKSEKSPINDTEGIIQSENNQNNSVQAQPPRTEKTEVAPTRVFIAIFATAILTFLYAYLTVK